MVSAEVEVERNGRRSAVIELPVVEATPALFTSDPWGLGQVAAFNQDSTLNSPSNAAVRGSILVLYATGVGLLDRPVEDGEVIPIGAPYPGLRLPVSVVIGPLESEILYAGPAPGFVAGLVQINVRIPADIYTSDTVRLSLHVGDFTDFGVTSVAIH